jgi:hypothetical protein
MAKRNWRDTPIVRSWVADVKLEGHGRLTTTIYGSNPTEAEQTYLREHPGVLSLVIRQENYPR